MCNGNNDSNKKHDSSGIEVLVNEKKTNEYKNKFKVSPC